MEDKTKNYNRRIQQIMRRIKYEIESEWGSTEFGSQSTVKNGKEQDLETLSRVRLCNGYPVN